MLVSVSFVDLVDMVNLEIANRPIRGKASATGDGETTDFLISPPGYYVKSNANLFALVSSEEAQIDSFNEFSGILILNEAPASGEQILFQFDYVSWPDTMVESAVNAGIQALFPSFYVEQSYETDIDGGSTEIALPDNLEFVKWYDTKSGGRWVKRRRDFELYTEGQNKVMYFFSPPPAGDIRVVGIYRHETMSEGATLGDIGLPDRAMFPIVSYACYYLLTQKQAPRIRTDVAVATQGQGTLSPRQMSDASNSFFLRFQMQLASVKMPPWVQR